MLSRKKKGCNKTDYVPERMDQGDSSYRRIKKREESRILFKKMTLSRYYCCCSYLFFERVFTNFLPNCLNRDEITEEISNMIL